ncbi:permease [Gemmatirosa kalamazoonensis]|uniref:Permease n=1 Tax=Gemmatirosa kalamazoonensis TaxID=861299 RepID=W0RFA2_9BACT|nr:ABC transporter permease [Gemmatirosa kalamazoonensis]AHG89754.1 permease [Gemmatirosa kalamazoonensis]
MSPRIPFSRPARAEVDDELAFHIERRVADYVARGMSPEAARTAALARLGDLEGVRSECTELLSAERRAAGRRDWLDDLRQDVRHGVRAARRAPLFSLLAVVTLALGIGANAAVFGVVKSVLLDALPYRDGRRLVQVFSRFDASKLDRSSTSPGVVGDIAERARSFAGLAVFNFGTFDVAYADETGARTLTAASVAGGFFSTLGVPAALGRTLGEEDGQANVAMLSHAAWQREFAGDSGVIGRSLRIERQLTRVVGVLPRGFVGPMGDADIVFPMDLRAAQRDPSLGRAQNYLSIVGRLARGATPQSAQRELDRLASELAREHPDTERGRGFVVVPLRDSLVGETRTPLVTLMTSAGLVLLITCANLAGALLSRTITRRKEFAVRIALGARRGRLVRQLLTESMVLALGGAAVGLLLATAGLAVLRGLALPALPPYADLSLDAGAVAVTLLAALVTGVLFGLAPAVMAGRWQPQGTLRDETRGTSEGHRSRRLRGVLVAGQIALALSLLAGAGLLVRSLRAMAGAPLGFTPDGVLTARVQLPASTYGTPEARASFFRQLEERLGALPGVRAVASVTQIPSPTMSANMLRIDGVTLPGDGPTFIPYMAVSDDYFALMGIRLARGRTFDAQDGPDAPPAIVVSETMARRYWPRSDPLGARIRVSPHTAQRWGIVVGVVRDVRVDPALPAPGPMAYATNRQDFLWGGRDFLLRTTGDPTALVKPAQRALAALDPSLPLRDPRPLRAIVDERLAGRRLPVVLMSAFGALALVLASVGVYAMFAAMTAAREREFGVRVALGSSRGGIAATVLRQGAAYMAAGLALGALGVVAVSRMLAGLLYGVPPFDPIALGAAAGTLVLCAAIALLAPVRRATRADPISVLR